MRSRPGALMVVAALGVALVVGLVVAVLVRGPGRSGDGPAAGPTDASTAGPLPGPGPEAAESTPQEDSYYPRVGDPGVDALHYDLDLAWHPQERRLDAVESLLFRAAVDADFFRLDLGDPLDVTALEVDGAEVPFAHRGKNLVVRTPVRADQEYTLRLAYTGTPAPIPAPTTRDDFSETGWTITTSGAVWTMQEPYGAFTWYAVNDHPSDKARYDFTITVAAPWTGVANGTMTSREVVDGKTVTTFELAEPAASYLITIGIGDYEYQQDRTASGTPLNYWVPRSTRGAFQDLRYARKAIEWAEGKLGPYPFASAGIMLTESRSGMETQTLVTLGDVPYARSREVIVHEMVHQWYGDLVTPSDWRDLWMNEGMAMYLQLVYRAEEERRSIDSVLADVAADDQQWRDRLGPPGAYRKRAFGEGNVYYCPAVMWNELRHRLGDEAFWRLVRDWPREQAYGNATREEWFDWLEAETGLELTAFFDAWIMGETTPPTT